MSISSTDNTNNSILAEICKDSYGVRDEYKTPENISDAYIISYSPDNSAYKYAVYKNIQNPNEIIIAYAGTDSPGDWISNAQMAINQLPGQYTQALNTYNAIKNENPNANITITGHSLGGSLAQLVGATTGANTVTFNSYGTSKIFESMGFNPNANYSNITNYNNSTDILNMINLIKNVHNLGNNFIIESNITDQIESHKDFDTIINSLNNTNGYSQPIALEAWLAENKEYENAAYVLRVACMNNLGLIVKNLFAIGLITKYSCFAIIKAGTFIILQTEIGHKVIELENAANSEEIFTLKGEFNKELNEADRLDALPSDPLIFDLDGDGKISLTDLDNGTNFDIDNDGFAQKISWVSGQDGILVLDKNNNGTIDNGLELFGENTILSDGTPAQGGIQALSELDTNNDGIIDANDSQFSDLKFLKADGTKVSLQDAGISQIILQYNEVSNADEHGNVMVKSASFVKTDGSVHQYGEFMLNQNHYESIHIDKLELPESYDDLPEVQGTGLVMSLKQAMVRDTSGELLNTLESFLQEDDLAQKREIVETLIYKWAGTENVSLDGRGLADGRKLATIEKFVGRYFLNEEGSIVDKEHVKHVLEESWNRLFDYVYAQLAVQTHGRELLAHIGIKYVNNSWVVDGGDSLAYFEEIIADDTSENKMHSKNLIRDFGTILHQYNYADNFENLTEYITQMQNLLGEEYVEMFVAGVSDEAWTDYWDITYADGVIFIRNVLCKAK